MILLLKITMHVFYHFAFYYFEGPCQIPSVTNGKLIEQSAVHNDWITHGKDLHYECFEGFSSKDSKLIRCNNGTWEPAPGCVRNVTFSLFFN